MVVKSGPTSGRDNGSTARGSSRFVAESYPTAGNGLRSITGLVLVLPHLKSVVASTRPHNSGNPAGKGSGPLRREVASDTRFPPDPPSHSGSSRDLTPDYTCGQWFWTPLVPLILYSHQ